MKKFILLAFTISSLIAASSCSKCFTEECPGNDIKLIKFASSADSTDLILTGKYLLDSLKITPLLASQGGIIPNYEITFSNPYIVAIEAGANTAGYIFQLDSLPPDTLFTIIGFDNSSKCCEGVHTFEQVILNGDTLSNTRDDLSIFLFK
ncbi:MAG: hypothetical protein IPM82_07835 [Saprospiraceae bacterium]|nr:hypothetical protein [Saprospiraceae bacterium]